MRNIEERVWEIHLVH